MIALIDIGISNINSVAKALKYLGSEYKVVKDANALGHCSKIILPGVGSFAVAYAKLEQSGLKSKLLNSVLDDKKPFLGICLGMQLIGKNSEEGDGSQGLGLIDAETQRIPDHIQIKIPHVGWNDIDHDGLGLFRDIKPKADFYFVHSYRMVLCDKSIKCFYTVHGEKIIAYVEKGNIYGAQFHPEKSQSDGLRLLKNFSELC